MHAGLRDKVAPCILAQKGMTSRPLAHQLRPHLCMYALLAAGAGEVLHVAEQAHQQRRPSSQLSVHGGQHAGRGHIQGCTDRGEAGGCPCQCDLDAAFPAWTALEACCTPDYLLVVRRLWDTAVAKACIAAGYAVPHDVAGPLLEGRRCPEMIVKNGWLPGQSSSHGVAAAYSHPITEPNLQSWMGHAACHGS